MSPQHYHPRDLRALSDDQLLDELMGLFADPVVRKVALYLRLKEEHDSRQRRVIYDWQRDPTDIVDEKN